MASSDRTMPGKPVFHGECGECGREIMLKPQMSSTFKHSKEDHIWVNCKECGHTNWIEQTPMEGE